MQTRMHSTLEAQDTSQPDLLTALLQEYTAARIEDLRIEYNLLRTEILHNDTLVLQILGAILVLIGTAFTVAFSGLIDEPIVRGVILVSTAAIALVGMSQGIDRARGSFLIASYLRIFVEPELPALRWETRLAIYRKRTPRVGFGKFINYQMWVYTTVTIICLTLATFTIVGDSSQTIIPLYVRVIFLVSAFGVTIWVTYRSWERFYQFVLHYPETFDPIWRAIRKEEKSKSWLKASTTNRDSK